MVRYLLALLSLIAIAALPVQIAQADSPQIAYITNDARSIHLVDSGGDVDRPFFAASGTLGDIAWTPDGTSLAYTIIDRTSARPTQRLFQLDASSGKSTEIKSSVPTIGPLAFFPDGKRLATTSAPTGLGFPHCLGSQFLTLDVASGQATPGADSGCIGALQVAPDSAALIATHLSGAPGSLVENVALGSGVITEITEPSNDVPFSGGGTVTANNQTLAHVARHGFDNSALSDLVLVDRDGSNPRVIWQSQLVDVAFAPDGSQLAVSVSSGTPTTESRNQSIWIIGSDGSNPHQVASGYLPGQSNLSTGKR